MRVYRDLVTKGFIPRELPYLFSSASLRNLLEAYEFHSFPNKPVASRAITFEIPKWKNFTRTLQIPNPLQFIRLAHAIGEEWDEIERLLSMSKDSLTTPVLDSDGSRAFLPKTDYDGLTDRRTHLACAKKYYLYADIANFFRSVYTHSIPWAIHTKPTAKNNRSDSLYGNKLDRLLRNCQDRQTMGLPVGSDTSMILSEILLTAVDIDMNANLKDICYTRYVDDYYFFVKERSDADRILAQLSRSLKEFELELNDAKTSISELPQPVEPLWLQSLKTFRIRSTTVEQKNDLKHFFSYAFETYHHHRNKQVLYSAISHIAPVKIAEENWDIYGSFLLQSATAETILLPLVGQILVTYKSLCYELDEAKLEATFSNIISDHSITSNAFATSWSMWIAEELELTLKLGDATVEGLRDAISMLSFLHAHDKGNVVGNIPRSLWQPFMKAEELYGDHWMLSYEALERDWLKNRVGSDFVQKDDFFSILREQGCLFLDDAKRLPPLPSETMQDEQNLDEDVEPFGGFYGGWK